MILSLLVLSASVAATGHFRHVWSLPSHKSCASANFAASFTAFLDRDPSFNIRDPELHFFKKVLKLTENETEQVMHGIRPYNIWS